VSIPLPPGLLEPSPLSSSIMAIVVIVTATKMIVKTIHSHFFFDFLLSSLSITIPVITS